MIHCIEQGYCTCTTYNCLSVEFNVLEAKLTNLKLDHSNMVVELAEVTLAKQELEAQLAEIHLGYGMRSRKAMHDEIAELTKQLEAVLDLAEDDI